jgi:hypothetical protein
MRPPVALDPRMDRAGLEPANQGMTLRVPSALPAHANTSSIAARDLEHLVLDLDFLEDHVRLKCIETSLHLGIVNTPFSSLVYPVLDPG